MAAPLSKDSLELLDKSDLAVSQLIDHAASILKVDLNKATEQPLQLPDQTVSTTDYTFREQWVLKWLLRRIISEQSQHTGGHDVDPASTFLSQRRPWMLLLYLLHAIPHAVCAEILVERNFFQSLDRCIRIALNSSPTPAAADGRTVKHGSGRPNDKPSKKRRRLSPEQDTSLALIDSSLLDLVQILFQVCCKLADILVPEPIREQTYEYSAGLAWTSSAQENAVAFAASLQVALPYIKRSLDATGESSVLSQAQKLLAFWGCRPVPTTEVAKLKEITAFNAFCLSPCLELLDLCREPSTTSEQAKSCIERLEKLLALHTILPLRTRFNSRQAKQWKKTRKCLSWQDIQPTYDDLIDFLSPQKPISKNERSKTVEETWRKHSRHLYSIAVRLIPKSDDRRKQWEQPWLDNFFASLCYVSWPALPTLEFTAPSTVTPLEVASGSDMENDQDSLCGLVEVALYQHLDISLQVLSYFAAAVLSLDPSPERWRLLSKMVSLDVNILIPGLGIPTTDYSINKFRAALHHHVLNESYYIIIRSGILLPLVSGFARSRAMKDFIDIWRIEMQNSMVLKPLGDGRLHAVTVWEDEDVFNQVREMVKQYAPPSLAQEILVRTLEGVTLPDGAPVAIDTLADVAICTTFLTARGVSDTSASFLQSIQNAATHAITKRSPHPDHHWRLWNLIYRIQGTQATSDLEASVLTTVGSDHQSLILNSLQPDKDHGNLEPAQWMERFERFSILVQQSSKRNVPFSEALRTEIAAIQRLTRTLPKDDNPWNGRFADLNGPGKLISACLGILSSYPEVLRLYPDLALTLLDELVEESGHLPQLTDLTKLKPCIRDLFPALIGGFQSSGSKQVTEKLSKAILDATSNPHSAAATQELITSFPIESISKLYLRTVASNMFDRLLTGVAGMSLNQIAAHLALMERLTFNHSIAFCQAEAWSTWIELLHAVEKREFDYGVPSAFVAARCVVLIFQKVISPVLEQEERNNEELLQPILHWMKKMIKSSSPIEYGISRLLALMVCVKTFSNASKTLSGSMLKDVTKVGSKLMQRIGHDLGTLDADDLSYGALFKVTLMLQALLDCQITSNFSDGLTERIRDLEARLGLLIHSRSEQSGPDTLEQVIHVQAQCHRLLTVWINNGDLRPKLSEASLQILLESPGSWSKAMERRQLASIAERASGLVETLDSSGQADLLNLLDQDSWRDNAGPLIPCIVAAVIRRAGTAQLADTPELVKHLSAVASLLECSRLRDQTRLILSLENAKLTLDLHPKIVNQTTIDSLIANISRILSSSSSSELVLHDAATDAIFDRVIAIIGSLLSRYRRRLSDRHHVLLPILQQLLRCLFYPGSSKPRFRLPPAQGSNPAAFVKSLPPWLRSSPHPLPPSSAEKYTRIVSSICNPTVSAAKSSSSHKRPGTGNELNDQTNRVKTLAGEHMQYLVMEYCRCSLDGEIKLETKEKLMPGMYVVLESMSRDLMRGMNAAMDPSARAIFKGLYDDWVRYGKWDKS